jgi:cbb3-type cytochrome oxidase subunit 1
MNLSDWLNLICILVWVCAIFSYGVLVGLMWSDSDSNTKREDKHDADDDTTPPPTATA